LSVTAATVDDAAAVDKDGAAGAVDTSVRGEEDNEEEEEEEEKGAEFRGLLYVSVPSSSSSSSSSFSLVFIASK